MATSASIGTNSRLSIVVPVYNSTESLVEVVRRSDEAFAGCDWEIILVDDGSARSTWAAIEDLARHKRVTGARLARNSGQQAALFAGILLATGDVIATIDDDLQFDVADILRLVAVLAGPPEVDLVYGWSSESAGRPWRRIASRLFRHAVATLLGVPELTRISPLRVFRARLRDAFPQNPSPGLLLDVHLAWTTQRVGWVKVENHRRAYGRSGYSFRRLLRLAVDVVTMYSTGPLRVVTYLGFFSATFGLAVLAFVLGQALLNGSNVAGFPFLASIILLFAGAQMLSLGIIGEYLGRIHMRVMSRPAYVLAERITGSETA